ncbi:MAG: thioesterase superfamily protein [Alphaproteobacteria bacterium]|nr:thioesterase superfamily protein [Alphaproteobacteria bacterium]
MAGRAKGPLPPHAQMRDFLPPDEIELLLDWVLANRARFAAAKVIGGRVDPELRVAETLRDFGPTEAMLRCRLETALPWIFERTGTRPFEPDAVELELAAHGHGAHFGAHRDIPVGPGRAPLGGDASGRQDRVISAVLYFHREPKGFSGGELRLHRFGSDGDPGDVVDLEPLQNSLVAFPSWATHEVREVACESRAFEDSRFAVNIWLCRELPRLHDSPSQARVPPSSLPEVTVSTWATDRLDALRQADAVLPPVITTLGLGALDHWEPGLVRKSWQAQPQLLNADDSVFGGYIAALADQVLAFAAMTVLPGNAVFRTLNLSVSFVRIAKAGILDIEARVISQTRRVTATRAEFRRADSALVAEASAQQLLQELSGTAV